jgi:hypothetical protein
LNAGDSENLEAAMNEERTGIGHGTGSIAQPGHGITSAPGLRPPSPGIAAPTAPIRPPGRETPLELVADDKPTTEAPKSKIHGISSVNALAAHAYKRPTNLNKNGAVRMRTFHCRLSEQGVEYLDQTVNDWLEQHPDIEVKFTTSSVGMWDGKLKEPTLILNVWY